MANIEQGGSTNLTITPTGAAVVTTRTPLVPLTPSRASVDTTSIEIVPDNADRKGLTIINLSSNTVSLGFGTSDASLEEGITLTPYGVFQMDEYSFTTLKVNAIASDTGSLVAFQEYT